MIQRDEFDKWAKDEDYALDKWKEGNYMHSFTRCAWEGWQAALKLQEWQPIETAPKDGSEVFGWSPRFGACIMRWTGWGGGVWEASGKFKEVHVEMGGPTHWKPVVEPQPPQETK